MVNKTAPRQTSLKFAALCLGIIAALAGLEILSTAWLTIRDGRYTPARGTLRHVAKTRTSRTSPAAAAALAGTSTRCSRIHTSPSSTTATIPAAFPAPTTSACWATAYPVARNPDRYVILLAGGSVASQISQLAQPGRRSFLEEELNRAYVSPTGKPFLVLNGGLGAWKQPQQLILLAIYGDFIDAVVTLDGYNEQHLISLASRSGSRCRPQIISGSIRSSPGTASAALP
jgi:hypothetical protein